MKDEEKDYEWNYDDGNRYRSSGRRLSSVWPLPPEQMGNWPESKNSGLRNGGWSWLCTGWYQCSIWTSVRIHCRCRPDQRTNPGSHFWMASGTALDSDRWCVLWSSSGLCIYVCLCKEQRTYNWIHYWSVHWKTWKKIIPFILLAVLYSGCCGIRRCCSRNL